MAISTPTVLRTAERFEQDRRLDLAIREVERGIQEGGLNSSLLERLGDLCAKDGQAERALEVYRQAAVLRRKDGFPSKAIEVLDRALRLAPDDLQANELLAGLFNETEQRDKAIGVLVRLSERLQARGQITQAVEAIARVVILDPNNLPNRMLLVGLYTRQGMKLEAAETLLETAQILSLNGHSDRNAELIRRAQELADTPKLALTLARIAIIEKAPSEARIQLQQGLLKAPGDAELVEALAELELQEGNWEGCLQALVSDLQCAKTARGLAKRALAGLRNEGESRMVELFERLALHWGQIGFADQSLRLLQDSIQDPVTAGYWRLTAALARQLKDRPREGYALQRVRELDTTDDSALQRLVLLRGEEGAAQREPTLAPQSPPNLAEATDFIPEMAPIEYASLSPTAREELETWERNAEYAAKSGDVRGAAEKYGRILEVYPTLRIGRQLADLAAPEGIVAQQKVYTKVARALKERGARGEAIQALDLAEALLPGSSAFHRRELGLLPSSEETIEAPSVTEPKGSPVVVPAAVPSLPLEVSRPEVGQTVGMEAYEAIEAPAILDPIPEKTECGADAPPVLLTESNPDEDGDEFQGFDEVLTGLETDDLSETLAAMGFKPFELVAKMVPQQEEPAFSGQLGEPSAEKDGGEILSSARFHLYFGDQREALHLAQDGLVHKPGDGDLEYIARYARVRLRRLGQMESGEDEGISALVAKGFETFDAFFEEVAHVQGGDARVATVEEVLAQFRKQVAIEVEDEDSATHYDLGLSYKGMSLLDDAIAEFQVAMRDPARVMAAASMLAQIEVERGDQDGGIRWLMQGIHAEGFPEEDALTLRFQLAQIYLGASKPDSAQIECKRIYDMDPGFPGLQELLREVHSAQRAIRT